MPSAGGSVQELMELVGLNPEHYNRFPAEFSGGQRQRIGVARALALRPELVVADEPVSALDVSIRAQVINLLADLQDELKLTYVFITHDLSVVRHVSNRVAVMYVGEIVEVADREDLYARPRHPYSKVLRDGDPRARTRTRLTGGCAPPPPGSCLRRSSPPSGCRFHPRCPKAQRLCAVEEPTARGQVRRPPEPQAACHFPLADGEELPSPRRSRSGWPGRSALKRWPNERPRRDAGGSAGGPLGTGKMRCSLR